MRLDSGVLYSVEEQRAPTFGEIPLDSRIHRRVDYYTDLELLCMTSKLDTTPSSMDDRTYDDYGVCNEDTFAASI